MSKILGLDLGSNSIGWALIDDERNHIIDMGVRIFEEGVSNLNTGKEESKNSTRRSARMRRRRIYRIKRRKIKLLSKLKELNLCPEKLDDQFFRINPYEVRAKAVNQRIEKYEIGRTFYHINQRRGYKSNRKEAIREEEKGIIYQGDEKINKPGINELYKDIKEGGYKTLGEYLYSLNPHEIRIRNRFTERKMYEDEFDKIWNFQKEFYPEILTDENYNFIKYKIIFYQRDLKSQKKTIGKCIFEKNKRRTPKSSPFFQEFRMLQQVNSLTISGGNRVDESQKALTLDEREKLINYLSENKELKLDKNLKSLKKLLNLDPNTEYNCNFQIQGKIDGLKTIVSLKNALKEEYNSLTSDDIYNIWKILHFAKDDEWLEKYLEKKYNFKEEAIKNCIKIKLEKDYSNLSHKAIMKILPYLRYGFMYHEATKNAGYDHSLADNKIEIMDYLPNPPNVTNPIVNVAMNQLKRVVNSIIDHYGKPDIIRVELARELKLSRKQRLEKIRENAENEKNNQRVRDRLINEGLVTQPSRNDIIKYKLWEECGHICPYTGKSISLEQLFITNEVDVEHILPYSRTLDDSYMNKTLCFRDENANKGNRTPYEAYSSNSEKYNAIKERIKNFPAPKARRFLMNEIEDLDQFIDRQLNDTRYISREAKKYLQHITENVKVSNGQATGILRNFWGLNNILLESNSEISKKESEINTKIREDHRHHAVDALVIALTNSSILRRLSTLHRKYGSVGEKYSNTFKLPFDDIHNKAIEKTKCLIVSRRVNKKVRGALHEETFYGKLYNTDGSEKTNSRGIPIYAIRKNLESLTSTQIKSIIDPKIREIVLKRIESFGVDINMKNFSIPKTAFDEPLYAYSKNGKKIKIKSVRIAVPSTTMIKLKGYNIWVEPGSNHHIEIFTDETGKKDGVVISVFEAMQRIKNKQQIINKNLAANLEFIMSLQINELIINDELPKDFDFADKSTYHLVFDSVYRVQKMDKNKSIVFRKHYVSHTRDDDNSVVLRRSPTTLNCIKVKIDPAGFLELADD